MAAGLGFKDFVTGEVLTAADVDGYLMQGIWVFASTAARDAAVTSPQEGNFAFTKDTNSLWYYDGATWVASGATGDIEGVTAGIGISGGGTSGTVTVTNSMATAIDAKGDLVAGTGADTFAKLTVGANGTILTADSAEATGLKWAAAAGGGGKLLQVVSATTSTEVNSSSTTYADTGLTATITPTSATSKIYVQIMIPYAKNDGNSGNRVQLRLDRSGTVLKTWAESGLRTGTTLNLEAMFTVLYMDSPATTSSLTYKLQFRNEIAASGVKVCNGGADGLASIQLLEIGA